MAFTLRLAAAVSAATILVVAPARGASVAASPAIPAYGQSVEVDIGDSSGPVYLPATRYSRAGNTITIDYEYLSDGFGPMRPDFGSLPVVLGELAPGNYTVTARLFNMAQPRAAPQTVSSSLPVRPPEDWGIYMVPAQPLAFEPAGVLVRSAAYFDATTMRAALTGNVIRVDFDYDGGAPVAGGGSAPPGMTSFATVKIAGLAPGNYRVEGWGRERKSGTTERYFERALAVGTAAPIVEYYAPSLDHYVMSAWPDEIAGLDGSPHLGFQRTGQIFKAWLSQGDAPYGAVPVCRFYASGPNSHFYTGDAAECQFLKSLEQKGRAEAAARGLAFGGWQFEAVAFYALLPRGGNCAGGTQPIYRAYNMRAHLNDSNHRFVVSPRLRAAMKVDWVEEGVAFCAPL